MFQGLLFSRAELDADFPGKGMSVIDINVLLLFDK